MSTIVNSFGRLVTSSIQERPKTALNLLKLGFGANNLQSRLNGFLLKPVSLPSQRYAALTCGDAILAPLLRPERSVVVNLFLPCELLVAMDLLPEFVEGFAGYLDGACCEHGFVEYAENWGVPKTYCSYHKALLGASLSSVLPKPQCVVHTTVACDANLNTFRTLASYWQVPLFVLDVPAIFVGDENGNDRTASKPHDDAVAYVADQFRSMAQFLQDVTHRKLDAERLKDAIRIEKRSLVLYAHYRRELVSHYFPNDPTNEMYRIFLTHLQAGSSTLEKYMELLLQDIRKAPPIHVEPPVNMDGRVNDEVAPVVNGEVAPVVNRKQYVRAGVNAKKRILWVHTLPFWQSSVARIFMLDSSYQLLGSDLSFDFLNENNELDEQEPFESMARKLLMNSAGGSVVRRTGRVLSLAKMFRADGVVWFCQWGCKQTLGGANLAKEILEREGFPVLLLDGDACDRQNINDGQMATKLQAFFEMLG